MLFCDNAGAAIEFLSLAGRDDDYNTNAIITDCTFENNGNAKDSIHNNSYRGSLLRYDLSGKNPPFTGSATDNIYFESFFPGNGNMGFTHQMGTGNFDTWTFSDNAHVIFVNRIFNSGNDFSEIQGTSNWYYQNNNGSKWTNMIYDKNRSIYGNANNNISRFDIIPDSDSEKWTARVYQAPETGVIQIGGWVLLPHYGQSGNGVRVRITKNGNPIWNLHNINGNDEKGISSKVSNVSVKKGDIIRFEVNCGDNDNNEFDNVSWIPTVAYMTLEEVQPVISDNSSSANSSKLNSSKSNVAKSDSGEIISVSLNQSSMILSATTSNSQNGNNVSNDISQISSNNNDSAEKTDIIDTNKSGTAILIITVSILIVIGGAIILIMKNKKSLKQ